MASKTIYTKVKAGTTKLMNMFKNPTQATWERMTRTPDSGGGYTETWASQGSINVVILPKSGNEVLQADRLQSEVTHVIYLLWDDANTITTKDRIVFQSRYFNIIDFLDIAEGEAWIKAMCKEGVAQ